MSEKGKQQNLNFIVKFLYEKCGIAPEEGQIEGLIFFFFCHQKIK